MRQRIVHPPSFSSLKAVPDPELAVHLIQIGRLSLVSAYAYFADTGAFP